MGRGRCPECGSTRLDQYRMPYGPMWCVDCGFRVEDKMAVPNPFLEGADQEASEKTGGGKDSDPARN